MKIVIIGAGVSGLMFSLISKMKNSKDDVIVIDHNNKIAKKMYATGNGKCNIGNININDVSYNNNYAKDLINEIGLDEIKNFYKNNGIDIKQIDDLLYPENLSADTTVHMLENHAKELGVKFKLEESLVSYDREYIFTNKRKINYDRLIFACGLCSYPKLGSDGSIINILKAHNYQIKNPKPGLCPIKCFEDNSPINGLRHYAEVTLNSGTFKYKEQGEVLFKKDGLSGIVIFNISSIIVRNNLINPLITLDLFPEISISSLISRFEIINSKKLNFLNGYFHQSFSKYLLKHLNIKEKSYYSHEEIVQIAKLCKNLDFNYKSNYDFENSQVSIGGVSLSNINKNLCSLIEKNIYFIGEIIDIDGLCGGYNLMWCLASAIHVAKNIK